jgi:hypothetical protein
MAAKARIPIKAGKEIADKYGYDQVIIVARKVGEGGGEHVTTYGVNSENCSAAAKIGDFFKFKLMGWTQ